MGQFFDIFRLFGQHYDAYRCFALGFVRGNCRFAFGIEYDTLTFRLEYAIMDWKIFQSINNDGKR